MNSLITKLFKLKYYPIIFQIISLMVFILLFGGSINITGEDANFVKQLRNTNLANLIVWSYWWPIIIITAVIIGRHWCSVCPVELITTIASKFGLKKKPGAFLKSKWVITIFYALIIIIAIHTYSIHRIPQRMSFYLLGLFILSIIIGLIYEKRSFCTYVCPIGNILGIYALLSRTGLRVKSEVVCKSCKTKNCIAKKDHYNIIKRSCTSNLYPPKIKDNRECILCSQCVKVCPHDNIEIKTLERPSSMLQNIKLNNAETALIVLLSGFVIYEVFAVWKPAKDILLIIPTQLSVILSIPQSVQGTFKAIILFIFLPTLFYGIFAIFQKYFSKEKFTESLKKLAILTLPIIALMHFVKALFKMLTRIPYIEYATKSYDGVFYANQIVNNQLTLNTYPILGKVLIIVSMLLGFIGIAISIKVIVKNMRNQLASKIMLALFSVLYISIYELCFYFNFI